MSPQVATGSVEAPLNSLYVSWKCGVVLFVYRTLAFYI